MPMIPTRLTWQARDILAWIRNQRGPEGARSQAHAVGVVVVDDDGEQAGTAANPLVVNDIGNVEAANTPLTSRDVWGRQISVAPYRLMELIWTYGVDDRSRVATSGTGSVASVDGALTLTVVADEDRAALRGKRHAAYQANRGHVMSTATMGIANDDAVRTRIGLFSDRSGVFFEVIGSAVYAVLRNTTGNTPPTPEDWTPGGGTTVDERVDITAALVALDVGDVTVNRLWDIRYQWRGAGNVEFYVDQQLVHTFERLGVVSGLSLATPALPFSVEVEAIGVPEASRSVQLGCVDVSSEGGAAPNTRPVVVTREVASGAAVSTEAPWIAVKVAPNVGGLANNRDAWPFRFSGVADNETLIRVYRNPATLTGGAWAASPRSDGILVREPTAWTGGDLVAVGIMADNDVDPPGPAVDLSGIGFLSPDEGAAGPAADDGDVLLITLGTLGGTTNELFTALELHEEL